MVRDESDATAALVEGPGTRIGPYKLLQQIGEGGFGAVFMAQQEKPVERKVALKIIKLGMDTRQVVARFEQERQALALMEHPNIARVLDAGATDTGRPYFVMELVKGDPIVAYSDKSNLTIDERLALFAQVCAAVQHAHSKGIIHRDLKPSNILVGTQDGKPQAKVIDFGIAKATSAKLTDKTLFTEHQQVIGTLQYMSPEQAEGSLDIDTRTDVYSLGVLLYELLAGSTPFDNKTLSHAMYGEVQRMIREVDPPKPSTRLIASRDTLANLAARRRVEPKRLGTLLRGELDWIVMKALEKDRARRYDTASGLAMDIQRYLGGEAVVAAPPSSTYRLRKFIRRHRVAATAGAMVAAALLIGVVAFAWQAKIASAQRDRAVAAEAESTQRADQLQKVADFQAQMLAQVDTTEAGRLLSRDVQARFAAAQAKAGVAAGDLAAQVAAFASEWKQVNATDVACELIDQTILKPAVVAVEQQFRDQPLVDAQLRQVLADLYHDLGLFDAALPLQERAVATYRRELGEEHVSTLGSLNNLGLLLQELDKLAEAEGHLRDGLTKCRRVLGDEHRETLNFIGNLGLVLRAQGKFSDAEPYYREALAKSRRVFGEEHPDTVIPIGNLGMLLLGERKLSEAEPYFREALDKSRRVMGEEHRYTLASIGNLGGVLREQGKLDEAEPYFREALDKSTRVLGAEHPETLAKLSNLGALLHAQGKLSEAEPFLREALEKRRRLQGEDDRETASSFAWVGSLLRAQGKLAEAESYYRDSLARYRRVLGDAHPETLGSFINLGVVLQSRGEHRETVTTLAPIESIARSTFIGRNAHRLVPLLLSLGKARAALGDYAAAEGHLLEANGLLVHAHGEAHRDTRDAAQTLVDLYAAWHTADPSQGHDAKSAEWKAKLAPPKGKG